MKKNRQTAPETSAVRLRPPDGPERASAWLTEAIEWARERRATDLHLFPSESEAALWVRIDGDLCEAATYPLAVHARMVARLKVMGRCSDYDGELLLEGRFSLNGDTGGGEARLSIVPTLRGEKAVIRLLAGKEGLLRLGELGFCDALTGVLRDAVDRPQGLLLAVGPSGCGKSTALYALLEDLHRRTGRPLSMVTIEDPIEQSLPCAAQISVDPARGVGFSGGLRAILRQDPEVVMIGEIRDAETAEAALQSALTGHRLLSSMHTLTAAEALVRLRQMGSPPYVIASALAGILNVRLVKLLCPRCRSTRPPTETELAQVPEAKTWKEPLLAEAPGCEACLASGHAGRTGVGEWIVPTQETAEALRTHQPTRAIASTLRTAVAARLGALELLEARRISLDDWNRLVGLSSLNLPPKEERA